MLLGKQVASDKLNKNEEKSSTNPMKQIHSFFFQQTPFIYLIDNQSNLLNANPFLLFITLKIQMVYFEQLRLLIILVMAYLSYRNISSITDNSIGQYEDPIEDEAEIDDENSQLESESVNQDEEQLPLPEKNLDKGGEQVNLSEEVQLENLPQIQQTPSIPSEQIVPEQEANNDPSPALAEVDENNTISKVGKRKLIKKTWKRQKKQNLTQTIIGSQEVVESEMDELKENQMIDI